MIEFEKENSIDNQYEELFQQLKINDTIELYDYIEEKIEEKDTFLWAIKFFTLMSSPFIVVLLFLQLPIDLEQLAKNDNLISDFLAGVTFFSLGLTILTIHIFIESFFKRHDLFKFVNGFSLEDSLKDISNILLSNKNINFVKNEADKTLMEIEEVKTYDLNNKIKLDKIQKKISKEILKNNKHDWKDTYLFISLNDIIQKSKTKLAKLYKNKNSKPEFNENEIFIKRNVKDLL